MFSPCSLMFLQVLAECLVDDFVVTESVAAVEVAIAESAAVHAVRASKMLFFDIEISSG